jgi:hypothetical protein
LLPLDTPTVIGTQAQFLRILEWLIDVHLFARRHGLERNTIPLQL